MRLTFATIALFALALPTTAQVPCGIPGVTVTVSPSIAAPGQVIFVTLTNNSSQLINLPSSCTFQAVFAGPTCSGTSVFSPVCLSVITPIPPGTSDVMSWDQRDDSGVQVPDGDYAFWIRYYDASWSMTGCCPTVTIASDPGTPYCFGDGSGTTCPCANSGGPGEGCANGGGTGATLSATGSSSVGAGDLVLSGAGAIPGQTGLYFQADYAVNGGNGNLFGDGLRCAGGSLVRLQVLMADGAGNSSTTIDIATKGGVSAGQTKRYQLWYRDPVMSPCGMFFNLTNGYEVAWTP